MTTRHLLLATLMSALFAPAHAQDARAGRPADGAQTFHFDALDHDARRGITTMRQNVVRNAPYTAQVVTERTQALADGNQIAIRRTTMTYRDGAGRTRHDIRDADGDIVAVTISDPVAGATLILHPRDRSAVRIARTRRDGGEDIIVKRVEGAGDAERRRDVRIQVPRALEGGDMALRDAQMQVAPLMNGAFADLKWASKAVTKDLGTRDVGGIKAEGKLRSYEIPAGALGNRNPIVVSDETWTAPDLQVTVYTKHSDPRSGDVVFRLENVRREEPSAALFTVPPDYTVRDRKGRGDK